MSDYSDEWNYISNNIGGSYSGLTYSVSHDLVFGAYVLSYYTQLLIGIQIHEGQVKTNDVELLVRVQF